MAIVLLLQARGGISAPELARELEVSVRTIYRDVDSLSAAGVPVYATRGPNGGVRLLDGYRTDLTGVSPGEAETLFLMGIPGPLDELGLGSSMDAVQRKVLAALPAAGRITAERVRRRILVDATGWDRAPRTLPWLPTIAAGLWAGHRLALDYTRADNRQVRHRVDPRGLVLKAGQWYLVAWVGRWDVTFRVSRVRFAEVLDEACTVADDFDLEAFWAASQAEFESLRGHVAVRIRVAPHAIDDLPRHLGEDVRSQTLEDRPDPSAWLDVELSFESLDEARAQLLGLGTDIVVDEPVELRHELARVAAQVVAQYHQHQHQDREQG
jgi:predicted DNA-binding transcriptional regulator YafY